MKTNRAITKLMDCDGNPICTNFPLAVDSDSVYVKDIDLDQSLDGTFTGNLEDLVSNYYNEFVDETATNPKTFTFVFNRPISCSSVGMASLTGNFSNTKLLFKTASGQVEYTLDDSANNTKYAGWRYSIEPQTFDTLTFEFHTADAVKISGIFIQKDVTTVSRMQALKPDGTVTNIDATAGGNLKFSLEELESGVSSNSKTQLNITPFHADGTEGNLISGVNFVSGKSGIDGSTETLQIVNHEHHEIHSGDHYFVGGVNDLTINQVLDFTWLMPNTTKWIHWVWKISTESETAWYVYENVTETNPLANSITPYNSNRNSSNTSGTTMLYEVQASLAVANADTDVTSPAILLDSGISGAGRDAGNEDRSDEIILKQNTLYCLRAVATAAGYINFHMKWYEHTNLN